MDLGQLAVVPAIGNDPMSSGREPGKIGRLGGACHRGKRGFDSAKTARLRKAIQARGIRTEQRLGQADHVDNDGPFQSASEAKSQTRTGV